MRSPKFYRRCWDYECVSQKPVKAMAYPDILNAMRPAHWVKNFLVLAPLFFTGRMSDRGFVVREALAFAVFCAAASAVYLFNDLRDVSADRAHERKKNRPYASGRIPKRTMWITIGACSACAAAGCVFLPRSVACMVVSYVFGMILYTVLFKRWCAAGAVIIALGMIARIVAGAEAIGAIVSAWVISCTFFLTCYVVTGKRLYDADPVEGGGSAMFDAAFLTCGAITFACYVFYCFTDVTIQKYESRWVVLSAVPVALGLWRYAAIVRRAPRRAAEHFQATLADPVMACALCAWIAVFASIIYA